MSVARFRLPPSLHASTSGRSAAMDTYPNLAAPAQRLLTMHATSCAFECSWSMWGRVCTQPRARLAGECAKMVFIVQTYMDLNTPPSTGADWEVLLCILEEVAAEAEQSRLVFQRQLMHKLMAHDSRTPFYTSVPCQCTVHLSLPWHTVLY
jgi:hypothetical protein